MINTFQFVMHNSIMKYSAKDPQICKPMKIKGKIKGVVLCLPIQNTKHCSCKQLLQWSYSWYNCYLYAWVCKFVDPRLEYFIMELCIA